MALKKLGSIKAVSDVLVTSADLASDVTGVLGVANGGTGQTTFIDGQLLIGNTTGNTLAKANLTQGTNVSIANGHGSIVISALDGNQFANRVFAGPTSGGVAAATFRQLVAADLPALTHGNLTIPFADAQAASAQAVANNTLIYIDLGTENADNDTMHDTVTNVSRITVKTAGKYLAIGTIPYDAMSAPTRTIGRIVVNRTTTVCSVDNITYATGTLQAFPSLLVAAVVDMSVNDYFELATYQYSGSGGPTINLYAASGVFSRLAALRVG